MKRIIILGLVFLLSLTVVYAGIDSSYACEDRNCIEGTGINFTVRVKNTAETAIKIYDVFIKDKYTNQVLGSYEETVTLIPTAKVTFEFSSIMPTPFNNTYTYFYVPCFTILKYNQSGHPTERGIICKKEPKSVATIPFSKIECQTHDECNATSYCNTFSLYECIELECEKGETISNHECVAQVTKTNSSSITGFFLGLGKDTPFALSIVGIVIVIILSLYLYSIKVSSKSEQEEESKPKDQ